MGLNIKGRVMSEEKGIFLKKNHFIETLENSRKK